MASGLVNVQSSRHHDMLVSGLWNFFLANHAVDFEIGWEGRSIRAHQLILDVFLSPRKPQMLDGRIQRLVPSLSDQRNKSSMELVMEFLYNGRVDVPREKLQNLLDVAKELEFVIMIEAMEIAIVNDKADCLFGKDMCSSRPVVRSNYAPVQPIPNSSIDDDEMDDIPAVLPMKSVADCNDNEAEKDDEADTGSNDCEEPDIKGGNINSEDQLEIQCQSSGKSHSSLTTNETNNRDQKSNANSQSESSGGDLALPPPLLPFAISNMSALRFPENRGEMSSSSIHGHIYSQQPAFPYYWKPILHEEQPDELEGDEEILPPPPMVKPPRRPRGGKGPYKCETCFKVFKRSQHLNEHMLTHTKEKPFKCHLCGKAYSQSGGLFVHMRTHTGVKPYKCNVCGKAFNQSGCLNNHLLMHTGERPHKCETCGNTFQRKQHLADHMLSHTAKKKFKCDLCQAEFSHYEWSAFNLHKLEHTGKPALVCDICGKSFAGRKNLCAHKRNHREAGKKLYQCHVCGQAFRVKHSMERHMRLHTGEKPYKCTICDKNFTCDRQLRRHLRSDRHERTVKGIE